VRSTQAINQKQEVEITKQRELVAKAVIRENIEKRKAEAAEVSWLS